MAEARIAVAEPRINTVEEITSPQTWRDVFFSFRSSVAKRYYKARYVSHFPPILSSFCYLTCIASNFNVYYAILVNCSVNYFKILTVLLL